MSIDVISPLRQRMIEDMAARKLGAGTQRLHISSSLDVSLHGPRRHESHLMAERREFTRPMVSRGAGLEADKAWRQALKKIA